MCILCVIQKWTRRVAALLPWLVTPLIGLWALSKLLPPDYRFEITSPRLACVIVLLVTLFWYEILMPKLSAWRAQRNARLRERKKNEAIELQKLRKTATRKCRNCKTPYRDQNPGGGKFMCSFCGHVSKRPVLELPVSPGTGMSNSGLIKEMVGKGGKLLNRWSENGWMCGQDWMENGIWVDGPFASKSDSWRRNGNGMFEGDDHCMEEKSHSGFLVYGCKLLTSFILSIRWLSRKIFRNSSIGEDDTFNAEHRDMLTNKRDEVNFHESRSEKARRKADEKRQARLERELLEEEERKQREEVARLVEEQRKLRDEKEEAEKKDTEKISSPTKDKDRRKEAKKKRLERKKERDRGSNKSNSDGEELVRKLHKESDRKQDSDNQGPPDLCDQKSAIDSTTGQIIKSGRGVKIMSASNVSSGTAGSRNLDRMKSSLLPSSKAFSGGTFFGRTANATAATQQEIKPVVAPSHVHTSVPKRDSCPPERTIGKIVSIVEDRNNNRLVTLESQPMSASKKSWHQLFTPLPSLTSTSDSSKKGNSMCQEEVKTLLSPGHSFSSPLHNNPTSFGIASPFSLPSYQSNIASTSLGFSRVVEPSLPRIGENDRKFIQDEHELFEDPCYDPDPVALLGPVSQSLHNFQLDMGSGFHSDLCAEKAHVRKSAVSPELSKPSPIESPLSRSRGTEDRNPQFSHAPGTHDMNSFPVEGAVTTREQRPWQVWDSTPLLQEDLSLISNPARWLVNRDQNRSDQHDSLQPSSQIRATSLFVEDPSLPHIHVNSGPFSPLSTLNDQDPWVQKGFISPLSDGDNRMPQVPIEETTQNERFFGSTTESGLTPGTRLPITNSLSNEWPMQGSREGYEKKAPGAGRHVRKGVASQIHSVPSDLVDRKK